MRTINRRDFLKVGAGGVVSTALAGSLANIALPSIAEAQDSQLGTNQGTSLSYAYYVDNDSISGFIPERNQRLSPSTLSATDGTDILKSGLATSAPLNLPDLESWAEAIQTSERTASSLLASGKVDSFAKSMGLDIHGLPDFTDVIAASVISLTDERKLNLALDFVSAPELERVAPAPQPRVHNKNQADRSIVTPTPVTPSVGILGVPPNVEIFGWRFQFRGVETHSLGDCVTAPVTHFHLEVFRALGGGRYQYASKFHLGTYRNQGSRCFVLWSNYWPRVCWRVCQPSRDDLVRMMKWLVAAAAVIIGVALAAWIIAVIAEVLATAIFIPLLLLV